MKETDRFISELMRIINGALHLDIDKVRNYTSFLADKLEKSGDIVTAERLRKVLVENDHQLRPIGSKRTATLPVDADSRFPILEFVNLDQIQDPPMILNASQWQLVNEFVSVAKSYAQLDLLGYSTSLSLLMYGPPGVGKSRLARHIARELDLDIYVARLDGLISSFLGSTAKNIRALFEFVAKTPCIMFLDEFDAIAKLRGDSQELGELKRVVNSFIQNLDALGPHSIVLAATNHDSLLDPAIWRRFSYRLEISYPNEIERTTMWREFLNVFTPNERELKILTDLSSGFSGSDIYEVCRRLHRRELVHQSQPTLKDAFEILQNLSMGEGEERRFISYIRGRDSATVADFLRNRNSKLYSHEILAQILGVSKATAHRWTTSSIVQESEDGAGH
ncbi:MAG: AAA family ATPase [Ignavibacteria bacterium]|nr:AAA family ATPase [Ignavibacteria bacterium]